MQAPSIATVIGGSGFIGRYVVKRLAARGYIVRVAVTDPEGAMFLRPMGGVGQIVPLFANITQEGGIARAVQGAALVVNLVGILAERRRGDFSRLQAEGAARAARLAATAGARRFVQMSAIGADAASPSAYGRSKAAGEAGVLAAFPGAAILRPSVVFGAEDQFFNRFAALAQLAPVVPVIAGGTRLQPVYVGDVADAVMAALETDAGGVFELGGPGVWTLREIQGWILAQLGLHKPLVRVPHAFAMVLAAVPGSGLTADQLKLLGRDNVADPALPGLAALGVEATPIDLIVPGYLARYRRGNARPAGVSKH